MKNSDHIVDSWVNYAKFYSRLQSSIDYTLQQQYQLSLNEFYFLYYLSKADNRTLRLTQLQPKVGLSLSAISRLVTRMESYQNNQIVKKSTYLEDKRSSTVMLTNEGEELLALIEVTLNDKLRGFLTDSDLEHILKIANE
ncbi:MarR family winged helix-turn-helix transcriptional regulator [Rossellomorea aquimaris]|uniref:MarR family transcriptional regulator n=1 Tax=Rossellomorea aquimaris TaxID=189382 RepID=A0A5D4UJH1_9BACI|nr:MarR family transcriptional regulator [Rossellomorea aquimaris]TYS75671.1 MarR family transcriptional regulator [Rossellomorea aquimaris]TYS87240.1 MarR family transcriptional regulator [Rossellomorea aquimaris]